MSNLEKIEVQLAAIKSGVAFQYSTDAKLEAIWTIKFVGKGNYQISHSIHKKISTVREQHVKKILWHVFQTEIKPNNNETPKETDNTNMGW